MDISTHHAARVKELLNKVIEEAVAAHHALESMVELGYVTRECATTAWKQYMENMHLVNRVALGIQGLAGLNDV